MGYQKQFNRIAIKYLPHHTLLKIALKLHVQTLVSWLNRYAASHIVDVSDVMHFSDDELSEYTKTLTTVKYWHGTGRFQYSENDIVDVLENILNVKGLVPSNDIYAIFNDGKPATSISFTRLRIIARSYADTHSYAKALNRNGSALVWSAYYYNLFYLRAMLLRPYKYYHNYKKWKQQAYDDKGHVSWGKKVNSKSQMVWDTFGLGSDIEGNYPIVIGISNIKNQIEINKPFNEYEVRTSDRVSLDSINHIEVPLKYINSTDVLLLKAGCSIKVYPLELGEFCASKQKFSAILGYTKNKYCKK